MNQSRIEQGPFDDADHLSREDLFLFQDDRLAPSARERCERHLRECPLCMNEFAGLADLESGLRARPVPVPEDAFIDRVVAAALRQESHNERKAEASGRYVAAARRYTAGRTGAFGFGVGFVAACLVLVGLAAAMLVGIFSDGGVERASASHTTSDPVSAFLEPVGRALVDSANGLTTALSGPGAALIAFLLLFGLDLFIRRRGHHQHHNTTDR